MITDEFAALFLTTINQTDKNPVHLLFNQWWQHAPENVKQAYVDGFVNDPNLKKLTTGEQFAEPLDLQVLAALAPGTLGRTYHDWIVENNLTAQIAMNYKQYHDHLVKTGQLDGMPEPIRYAILRGFQTHDFQHVVTGYNSSGLGEIALQAFCLAQIQFPYFGMWISVVTTKMTFLNPQAITPLMDAITDGWQLGRSVGNIQAERWEEMLDWPLADVRAKFNMRTSPLLERMAS
ncbi:MAG TPA: Coq4 family protein [Acidimicrobiales bacterium]|nr:Coq4 family protein [Acidimicrobiales bacterium]